MQFNFQTITFYGPEHRHNDESMIIDTNFYVLAG